MDGAPAVRAVAWLRPVIVALVLLAAGAAVAVFFLGTVAGQELDASTFAAVVGLREDLGSWPARLRTLLPVASAALLLIALIVTLVRRNWRAAVPSVLLPAIALVLSTVLKDVIPRPDLGDHGLPENSFPSGHTAVTIACLIAFLWLLPRRRAVVAVLLTVLATAASAMQVISYAHRLSDVIGGALLAGAIAACFLQRVGAVRAAGRVVLWALVVVAAVGGVWQLAVWWDSVRHLAGALGVILLSGAAAAAAIAVGVERAPTRRG